VDSINYIRRSLEHYCYESQALQITPWVFNSSKPEVIRQGQKGSKDWMAMLQRGGSPASRSEGRESLRSSWRSKCTTCRGLRWSEKWIPTRVRSGGGGINDDGDALMVGVGGEPAHELQ
jgi:hypothetical protein